MTKSALLLFAHGSRDPAWAHSLQRLAAAIRQRQADLLVDCSYLEFIEPTLEEAVARLAEQGVDRLTIAPVFWAAGGHVTRDLPALVEAARARYPTMAITVLPVLADLPGVMEWLAERMLGLAEGSR